MLASLRKKNVALSHEIKLLKRRLRSTAPEPDKYDSVKRAVTQYITDIYSRISTEILQQIDTKSISDNYTDEEKKAIKEILDDMQEYCTQYMTKIEACKTLVEDKKHFENFKKFVKKTLQEFYMGMETYVSELADIEYKATSDNGAKNFHYADKVQTYCFLAKLDLAKHIE